MSATAIPEHEVSFFSSLSPAHTARLFEWRGGLYRAIRPEAAELFDGMAQCGLIDKLVAAKLLVNTERTGLHLDGYSSILRHERIPFVTYPFEWSAAAYKDAALTFLDLNLQLAEHGLVTRDAHPWNIVFDGARPLFVDFGSFAPLPAIDAGALVKAFRQWFILPLRLMSMGRHRIARLLLRDSITPASPSEMQFLLAETEPTVERWLADAKDALRRCLPAPMRKVIRGLMPQARPASDTPGLWRVTLEILRREVTNIALADERSGWSGYYDDDFPRLDDESSWTAKQASVAEALGRLPVGTLHDVGCNRGWYAQLAARRGWRVLASDMDEACLNRAQHDAQTQNLSMTPLYMDVRDPASGYGWCGTTFPAAPQRLKADCVLALAILHHLVFRSMADFSQALDGLSCFTRRDLVIEFVSKEDEHVSKWWNPQFGWYTLDGLAEEARRRFREVQVMPSHPRGRQLLVCRSLRAACPAEPRLAA